MLAGALGALLAAARIVTLEEAVLSAREHQPQLRQARYGTRAAQARADEARAPLLPQLTAAAGYQRTTANNTARPGAGGTTADPTFNTYNFFNTSVGVSQLLWDFGQTADRYRAAGALAEASADNERAAALQVLLNVRSAFFDARAQKALFIVARDTLENQRRHLEQTQGFVEAGTRPQIDLAQARADTANAEVGRINAENAYATSRASLNLAMGVAGALDYEVADESLAPLPGEDAALEPLLAEAEKARPELASLATQVRAAELTMHSFEGAYFPSIGASAGLTQGGTRLSNLGWNVQAGLNLTWGIFQGGLTTAQVHEAEANLGALQAQLDLLRQQLRLELDQARLAVQAGKASLSATQDAVVAAKQRLELAEGRYQTGVGSAIELGDAQIAVTNAAAQVVQADYRLSTARAQLLKSLGRQ